VARRDPAAVRRLAEPRGAAPPAAPVDPECTPSGAGRVRVVRSGIVIVVVPILAPFPDVALHVVKTEGVRSLLAARVGPTLGIPLEPGELAQARLVVAEAETLRAPRAAGILPLRLGRQAVALAPQLPLLPLVQPVAEGDGLLPGDAVHRQVVRPLE